MRADKAQTLDRFERDSIGGSTLRVLDALHPLIGFPLKTKGILGGGGFQPLLRVPVMVPDLLRDICVHLWLLS